MPTTSQLPSQNPTSISHKARIKQGENTTINSDKARSGGGILLDKTITTPKNEVKMSSSSATKMASPPPEKGVAATSSTTTGPNRQRRRPRKLNKEPPPEPSQPAPGVIDATEIIPPVPTGELEALKSRVRGLEAKVEELYNSGALERSGRSPRRRGKGRKGSLQQVPPASTTIVANGMEGEEEADEELGRLEHELEVARRDLETYKPRPRARRSISGNTEYVEDIPRGEPGVDDMVHTGDRQVTLTGSYRIPLPSTVSMSDVKNIQSGVSAAQNVAKSFLEQRRAGQAVPGKPKPPASKPRTPSSASASSMVIEDDKQTWSEWFGGYSVAISRAMKNIEAEAAVESQKRKPPQTARAASAPAAKAITGPPKSTKPASKANSGTTPKKDQRTPLKPRTVNSTTNQE